MVHGLGFEVVYDLGLRVEFMAQGLWLRVYSHAVVRADVSDPAIVAMPITLPERDFFIDNLLVRIHFIIEMIWWTGLAPWEFEFPFPGSLISTFRVALPITLPPGRV